MDPFHIGPSNVSLQPPRDAQERPEKPQGVAAVQRRLPSEFNDVSKSKAPFSEEEIEEGVLVAKGSRVEELWNLLTSSGPSVRHPYDSSMRSPPIEEIARQTRLAGDLEIELHATFLSFYDRLKYVDRQRSMGVPVKTSRGDLILRLKSTYNEWDLARLRSIRFRDCYESFQEDRVERCRRAIELCEDLGEPVGWVPGPAFVKWLREHTSSLRLGLTMNE